MDVDTPGSSTSRIGMNGVDVIDGDISFQPVSFVEISADVGSECELSSKDVEDVDVIEEVEEMDHENDDYDYEDDEYQPDPGSPPKYQHPLSFILPPEYKNVSVTSLFPDFRPGGVLRHSKLFGPGKNLPHIWEKANKRRNYKKNQNDRAAAADDDDNVEEMEVEEIRPSPSLVHDHIYEKSCFTDFPLAIEEVEVQTEEVVVAEQDPIISVPEADEEEQEKMENSQNSISVTEDSAPTVCKFSSFETYNLWRHGPAEYWYDQIGLPDDEPRHFDYGFKLKAIHDYYLDREISESEPDDEDQPDPPSSTHQITYPYPDECYEMITQLRWEDNVILDKDDDAFKESFTKNKLLTWTPVKQNAFSSMMPRFSVPASGPMVVKPTYQPISRGIYHREGEPWHSLFPVDTEELINYPWEKEIIWDPENMDEIPIPRILELDPNDDNIVISVPDEPIPKFNQVPVKTKIPLPHMKKSKILLGKAGLIKIVEEDEPDDSTSKSDDKDPYNISNDDFYQPKRANRPLLKLVGNLNNIQHPIPVLELRPPYIPTYLNPSKLLSLYRPSLRVYKSGSNQLPGPHTVFSLTKRIQKKAKLREEARVVVGTGAGDEFLIRAAEDLSGMDGELVLIEYVEQYPPILSMIGMASKIKNYYKRKADKEEEPVGKYGETVISHTTPFLGIMHPGQLIRTIENNLYRAPIYQHDRKSTDFLILRTRNNFYIRTFDAIFTAGQECPLYEVPCPKSKKSNEFTRDSLGVFIYRLFWDSTETPKKLRMEDIKRAFPNFTETMIRKRLKLCADFARTGPDQHQWILKSDFRLPPEEELRQLVTPEQYCAYFSMLAAEQRLCSAGYVNQYFPRDREGEEIDEQIDDEVKNAPWNTTRAFVQAMRGKCIMQIDGPADPTGCGEGFSYVRVSNKPINTSDDKVKDNKKSLTGTDADLRKLSLPTARKILRNYNVPKAEIQRLSRWEVIDVVRTLSTEKAKNDGVSNLKYSRLKGMSSLEHQERYREDCQRIFDLQNRVLYSKEVLSSDDGSSSEEEEVENGVDLEELGKNVENILMARKTNAQIEYEKEEAERLELRKMIHGDDQKKNGDNEAEIDGLTMHPDRVLKIQRRYKIDGREFIREEIVRNSKVIDIYVRIRKTKDDQWINKFTQDASTKKEKLMEKRRQLALLKNANKPKLNGTANHKSPAFKIKKKAEKFKPVPKVVCGSCKQSGHMKSNKLCPNYDGPIEEKPLPPVNVAMTEEQEEKHFTEELKTDNEVGLVKVDGIKLRISGSVLKQVDEIKRQSLILKVPKEYTSQGQRSLKRKRLSEQQADTDYFEGKARGTNRRRIDPQISLCNLFENIISELRSDKESNHFLAPVSQKVPNYYEIIKNPIDLQTMREKNRNGIYHSRDEFNADLTLMVDNSRIYNGEAHIVTRCAQKLYEIAQKRLTENEEKIILFEKEIQQLIENGLISTRPRRLK